MARSPRIPGFSSDAARARFLAVYDRVLQRLWPVPVRAEDIATSAGTVRIYRAGPNGEDPYVLLTMLGGNALAWHRWTGASVTVRLSRWTRSANPVTRCRPGR